MSWIISEKNLDLEIGSGSLFRRFSPKPMEEYDTDLSVGKENL